MDKKGIKTIGVVGAGAIPLASRLHSFKDLALAEAYSDAEAMGLLEPKGAGYLDQIPELKDALIHLMPHVPILRTGKLGYYYLRKLSRSERKYYLQQMRANEFPITEWLSSGFTDMDEFVCSGFRWDDTAQGYEYWERISNWARWATKDTNRLTPQEVEDALYDAARKLK